MIRPDGTVVFSSPDISITPRFTLKEFFASPLFPLANLSSQNASWSHYSFRPVSFAGEEFAGLLSFDSKALKLLVLCSLRPEFGTSWNDYSVEKERAKHCFQKRLLTDLIGRPPDSVTPRGPDERDADICFDFPWGHIAAWTDFKIQTCDICLRYDLQNRWLAAFRRAFSRKSG